MSEQTPSRAGRRATDRPVEAAAPATTLPVPAARPKARATAEFEAQLLSEGPRRGLKGGQDVLTAARSTYLSTEWSGPADRRPPKGLITKAKI